MFKKIFLLSALAVITSCAPTIESPVVYFSNSSSEPVREIQCSWAGQNALTLPSLNPGDSRSQSFYMHHNKDFFGFVTLSWRNNRGERIAREFYFKANNLPSIGDHTTYNYVQFYLDQEEMELVSSDAPDLAGKTRKMDRLLAQMKEVYAIKSNHSLTPEQSQSALIAVKHIDPQINRSVPYWESSNSQ